MTGVAASPDDARYRRRFRITVATVAIGQLFGVVNFTILVTAAPAMLADLAMTPIEASWVFTATLLGNTAASPIWGRLADRHSPMVLIRISIAIVLVATIIGSLAPSAGVLIFARALQGVGFGGVFSLGAVVLANIIPPRERGRFFGVLSALQLGGQLGGPLLGGLMVESPLGWRGCFDVIIPGFVAVLVLSAFALPLRKEEVTTARIDWPGAILLALGVSSVLIWVSFVGDTFDAVSWSTLLMLGGGLLVLVIALLVERRATNPVLPLQAMRGRVPVLAAVSSLAAGLATMPLPLLMTYYLQIGRGIPPTLSGLIMLASAVGVVAASFVVGARSGRTGRLRRYLVAGAACLVLAAQNSVGVREVGSVTGFMSFAQLLGGSLGLSLFSAVVAARLGALEAGGMSQADAYATGVPGIFLLSTALAVVVLVLTVLLPPIRLRRTLDIEPGPDPIDS